VFKEDSKLLTKPLCSWMAKVFIAVSVICGNWYTSKCNNVWLEVTQWTQQSKKISIAMKTSVKIILKIEN